MRQKACGRELSLRSKGEPGSSFPPIPPQLDASPKSPHLVSQQIRLTLEGGVCSLLTPT